MAIVRPLPTAAGKVAAWRVHVSIFLELGESSTDIGVDDGARTESVAWLGVVVEEPVRVLWEQVQTVELRCCRLEFGYQVRVDAFVDCRDSTGEKNEDKNELHDCRGRHID